MSRKVFDMLASGVGLVVVVVLLVAGGLLMWGYSFTHSNVHNQLAQQEIYFPPKAAFAHPKAGTEITPAMIPSVSQYAGQQLLTGAQAKVWANDFIAVHLSEMPYHGVYAKLSTAARAEPDQTRSSRHSSRPPSRARRSAGCCSRPTPSRRSAKSCSGARSPRSAWPSSWPCSSPSASATPGAPPRRRNCWRPARASPREEHGAVNGPQTSTLTLHGRPLTYAQAGNGPVLLLIHGMAGTLENWQAVIEPLARQHTVVAPDLPGHGGSAPGAGDYSLGALATGLRDLLVALGHERATLVGHSLGGGIAMQFAYQFPEITERLVLVSSGGLGPEVSAILRAAALPGRRPVHRRDRRAGQHRREPDRARALAIVGLRPNADVAEVARGYASLADRRPPHGIPRNTARGHRHRRTARPRRRPALPRRGHARPDHLGRARSDHPRRSTAGRPRGDRPAAASRSSRASATCRSSRLRALHRGARAVHRRDRAGPLRLRAVARPPAHRR